MFSTFGLHWKVTGMSFHSFAPTKMFVDDVIWLKDISFTVASARLSIKPDLINLE